MLGARLVQPHAHALLPPPQAVFAKLLRDASEGLPVAGRPPVWDEVRVASCAVVVPSARRVCHMPTPALAFQGRPTVVHDLTAQKARGFVTYERRCAGVARRAGARRHAVGGCLHHAALIPCL